MKNNPVEGAVLPRWMRAWERFWFSAMDPTPLALIRILTGLIVLYTFVAYSFALQDLMGPYGWVDLQHRAEVFHDRPILITPLQGTPAPIPPRTEAQRAFLERYRLEYAFDARTLGLPPPETDEQMKYAVEYTKKWGAPPPAYPETEADARYVDKFREKFKQYNIHLDPRTNGLRLPRTEEERKYLEDYTFRWGAPPPAYVASEEEAKEINQYREREGFDPRVLYVRGAPIWSMWMHVIDPTGMAIVQGCFILFALLFTLGVGTRVTSVLTWAAQICYIHRNVNVMFGVDTMTNILLIYLMIGPSGAALSLDRLIGRWWRGETGTPPAPPAPSVTANVAIRLLQIHISIVYLAAGLAKLLGTAWWNGTALWNVLGNFEFAPMHIALYNDVLRYIARDQLRLEILLTSACYFTLLFEIGYAFLIWFPRTRWVYLTGAILLHGTIGVFMGLKTFSMIMLVMNMGFLRPEEVHWLLGWFRWPRAARPAPALEAVTSVKK